MKSFTCYCIFWAALAIATFIFLCPWFYGLSCLVLEDPKPSSSSSAPNTTHVDPIAPPPHAITPSPQAEPIFEPVWGNLIILSCGSMSILFLNSCIKVLVLYVAKLNEAQKFWVKLIFGVIFHFLFAIFEEKPMNFLRFVTVTMYTIVLLKFLQDRDETGISEELGNCFIKFGVEYLVKYGVNGLCRIICCLLPFGLSLFAMFSQSVKKVFYKNVTKQVIALDDKDQEPVRKRNRPVRTKKQKQKFEKLVKMIKPSTTLQGLRGQKSEEEEEIEDPDYTPLVRKKRKREIKREEERVGEEQEEVQDVNTHV